MNKAIICEIDELVDDNFCNQLKATISNKTGENSKYLLDYPVVYIHDKETKNGKHNVYVGESNDIISRTQEHYNERKNNKKWQSELLKDNEELKMYVIGHEHFNKSMTLDVENKLFNYLMSIEQVGNTFNSRGNPQGFYFPNDEFDSIFSNIWKNLRKFNSNLFLSESEIKNSAIFKASPLHKLTIEQKTAKEKILNQIYLALGRKLDHQLIFVEGEAGSGKTVLNSSTYYDLLQKNEDDSNNGITCCLMVNHDEQMVVYKDIVEKLNLKNKNDKEVICKPTHFINTTSPNDKIDVAFVDEAHLLLTQGKQAYRGKNQLTDIMERAKVTVIMFDAEQVLTAEQYWEDELIEKYKNLSKEQGNYIELKNQIRMHAQKETLNWIEAITKNQLVEDLHYDSSGYDIKIFDKPLDLYNAIKEKANTDEYKLSRVIASYDWGYSNINTPDKDEYWSVKIDNFIKPWNRELQRNMTPKQKRKIENLAWAEQPQTIDEIGSTFTIQGFDLSYSGVIIGPSVAYRNGKVIFLPENSKNEKAIRTRTLSNGTKQKFGEELIKHELRVLLTRGINGLYIYACDKELNEALKASVNKYQYLREDNKNRHK